MPFENFNEYTEVDQGNDVAIESSTKVSWTILRSRYDTAYLCKDFGVPPTIFIGDFTHKFEMGFSNMGNTVRQNHYILANYQGDEKDIRDAGGDAVNIFSYDDDEKIYAGFIENGGSGDYDNWPSPGPQPSTNYYVTVERDDDGGDNGTGLLTVYICTGNHYGEPGSNLEDTLAAHASAGEQNDYHYAYSLATYDDNSITNTSNGYTQNLDLGLAGFNPALATRANNLLGA